MFAAAALHIVKGGDPLGQGRPPVGHQTVTAEHGSVQVDAASIEGVRGRICRCAEERGWYWSPRNEGEAASSQKLVELASNYPSDIGDGTYEWKGEHDGCKGVSSTKERKTCLLEGNRDMAVYMYTLHSCEVSSV